MKFDVFIILTYLPGSFQVEASGIHPVNDQPGFWFGYQGRAFHLITGQHKYYFIKWLFYKSSFSLKFHCSIPNALNGSKALDTIGNFEISLLTW